MELSYFKLSIEENIAYLQVNHPPANTLNAAVIEELSSAMKQLETREDVKVIVVTGDGKFFVAGADIQEFTEAFGEAEKASTISEQGQALCNQIENIRKPVIAAINGHCLGGGLELAMGCHLRFAAEGASMGLPELNLGLLPSFGGTQRLKNLTNKAKAAELILSSKPIKGAEAKTIGLVNDCFPDEDLMPKVKEFALALAAEKSAESVKRVLELVMEDYPLQEGLQNESKLFGELFETEDGQEGVRAFLDKRAPAFKT
ncbi:MAG TPA: enoyl-CoA hydratase-related protein [Pseudogracilibacillus sp.]|nr:enoyl-CoA hydratase-related protein [Pseudogracilibacillus sp.]